MKNIIISGLDEKSGKTVAAYAIAKLANKKVGYMKPIGDNVIYKDKKLMDYDTILFTEIFGVSENPEELCLGMHHSKILHFYKEPAEEFMRRYKKLAENKELFIIEGGEFLWKGSSISLDAHSISKKIDADVIFVISGDYHEILDEIYYISKLKEDLPIKGVILNKVNEEDVDKIKESIEKFRIKYLGFITPVRKLRAMKVRYIAEKLFAKVVAGENGLNKYVENVFIAAQSAPEIRRHPDFKKENKLIITGGDRSDVITACIEDGTSGIILTNNIIPSANILAKANEKAIPLLSVRPDTYSVAKLVENIQPVILPDEKEKLEEIEKAANIDIEAILE